jgi:hypothetical protein
MSVNSVFKVEPADAIIHRFQARRALRSFWQKLFHGHYLSFKEIEPLANQLGVSAYWLLDELTQSQTFGALFEKIMQQQQKSCVRRWPLIDIKTAIIELRQSIAALQRNDFH